MNSMTVLGLDAEETPLWIVVAILFLVVLVRSHATYWVARGASQGTARAMARRSPHYDVSRRPRVIRRIERWTRSPATDRALRLVARWGPPAVTLAYVTVGAQTAILVAAGFLRMPYLRFMLASIPGAIAWALIWATVGFGVFWGAVRLAAASPWTAGIVALAVVTSFVVWRRRRRG